MNDIERDAHLREALRHAPDAQAAPPSALSDAILREARAKARDPKATEPPAPAWATRLWAWLARPAVATGLVGVMAATLVGLMWWDEPMDVAMPRRPAPVAARPSAAAPAPASAAAPAPKGPTAAQADAAGATPGATRPAATPPRPLAEKKLDAVPHAAPSPQSLARPAPPPPAPQPAAPALPSQETAVARAPAPQAATREAGVAAGGAAMSAPAPAPEPVQAPAAPPVTAEAFRLEDRLLQTQKEAKTTSRSQAARAELNELRSRREAEAFVRLSSVRALVASEPARWRWQRGTNDAQAMSDAVYGWLGEVDSAAAQGWQRRTARDGAATLGAPFVLLQDGKVQHTLQLTERGVLWQRGQDTFEAPLAPELAERLRSALEQAAR